MANGTFNVSEFNTIYAVLNDNSSKIDAKSGEIANTCYQLSQLIKSADSNLSSAYLKVGETMLMAKKKILSLLGQLENEMKVYAAKTIANEQQTSADLDKLNTDIENIAAGFRDIAGRSF